MKTRDKVCFVAAAMIAVVTSGICFASDDGDFQYWSTADVSFDINKDWKFTFQEELRFGESGRRLYYQHYEPGLTYSGLAQWIDLGFNYRQVIERNSKGKWKLENQPNINVTLKGKMFGLEVSDRSRIEYRILEDRKDVWRYRNKFTVKLPFELTELKLQPYVADEIFVPLDDVDINTNRLYAGVPFKLAKNIGCDLYYLWQSSKSNGGWTDVNVVGTALKFSF
ncbi:MAG: DUF2490 domain-containing protein [Sedimentisphaerales bacterium]|nr:DUF2490 domain-containing protein [Sedimentisphaerales bacterium]